MEGCWAVFFGLRSYLESGSVSGLYPSLCCKSSPFHFCQKNAGKHMFLKTVHFVSKPVFGCIQACVVNRALFIFVKKMQENICFWKLYIFDPSLCLAWSKPVGGADPSLLFFWNDFLSGQEKWPESYENKWKMHIPSWKMDAWKAPKKKWYPLYPSRVLWALIKTAERW